MNRKSDPWTTFDAEPALLERSGRLRRQWPPALPREAAVLDVRHWSIRASRGHSWHRAGRATH
jgi:hypothetical protein